MKGFSHSPDIETNCRQILFELIEHSQDQLNRDSQYSREILHEARRNFKKIRALLRLVRHGLGDEAYKKENYFFRDLGRALSKVRDTDSSIEIFKQLVHHELYWQNPHAETVETIQQFLDERRYHLYLYDIKTVDLLGSISEKLETKKEQIGKSMSKLPNDFDVLASGLKKIYKKGLKRFHAAYPNPDDEESEDVPAEAYHEWRKEVKYLRYQLDMLAYIWPDLMAALEDEAHHLTDLLGLEHDLQVLKQTLKKAVKKDQIDANIDDLYSEIARWQNDLRAQAEPFGQRMYAEKPKRFIKRIRRYEKTQRQIQIHSQK